MDGDEREGMRREGGQETRGRAGDEREGMRREGGRE